MAVQWEPPRETERDRVRYKPFRPFGSHSCHTCAPAPRPRWDCAPIGPSILARRNASDNEGREWTIAKTCILTARPLGLIPSLHEENHILMIQNKATEKKHQVSCCSVVLHLISLSNIL